MGHAMGRPLPVVVTIHARQLQTLQQNMKPKQPKHLQVGVVSAPFNLGQRREGVKDGPTAIKETGFLTRLTDLGVDVVDYGSVPMEATEEPKSSVGPDGEHNHLGVLSYNRKLASSVTSIIQKGRLCLTLGGDHSIAIGTINGHAQANTDHQVVVLWVDAHADINTGPSSPSGNMHGMPLSHHLQELSNSVNRTPDKWPQPCMNGRHLAYIGLRDVDAGEKKILADFGILAYGIKEVDQLGINEVIQSCLDTLQPSETRPLHVSFDIDALDSREAPSTGTPVRAGLTLREGLGIVEAAQETGYLKAFDMVEVNPALGSSKDAELTTEAAKTILLAALAGHRGT